jgi:hypothetical protein
MDSSWKFDQPPNCAVITLRSIVEHGEPVLHVTHDADDHGWQFLGAETPKESDAMVVLLKEILARDATLRELADLPVGWHAWRKSVRENWIRELNPNDGA